MNVPARRDVRLAFPAATANPRLGLTGALDAVAAATTATAAQAITVRRPGRHRVRQLAGGRHNISGRSVRPAWHPSIDAF